MAKQKPKPKMSTAMLAVQPGNYSTSMWYLWIIAFVETRWPDAVPWIEAAANIIPAEKLSNAFWAALADWQEGKSFTEILKEALAEWVDIVPGDEIRMTAKAPAAEPV